VFRFSSIIRQPEAIRRLTYGKSRKSHLKNSFSQRDLCCRASGGARIRSKPRLYLGTLRRSWGHLPFCVQCSLSTVAGAATRRGVSLGRRSREGSYCLSRPLQSRGNGAAESKRIRDVGPNSSILFNQKESLRFLCLFRFFIRLRRRPRL
jgi:hypothetical protein